jgi:hypothetical protein
MGRGGHAQWSHDCWLVDWPWAARGSPVFDLVGFCLSVAMQGGPEPALTLADEPDRTDGDRVHRLALSS